MITACDGSTYIWVKTVEKVKTRTRDFINLK